MVNMISFGLPNSIINKEIIGINQKQSASIINSKEQ